MNCGKLINLEIKNGRQVCKVIFILGNFPFIVQIEHEGEEDILEGLGMEKRNWPIGSLGSSGSMCSLEGERV
jgi:hypothetical protein